MYMNVCEAHPCCCFSLLLIHTRGSVLPLRRNWVKERKGVWKRRIYRKYASCKRLQTQDENLRADVVLSRWRGSSGQWFPETEYVSVRHLCGNKWHAAQIELLECKVQYHDVCSDSWRVYQLRVLRWKRTIRKVPYGKNDDKYFVWFGFCI